MGALCQVAAKASSSAPDLAREMLEQALAIAIARLEFPARQAAADLLAQAGDDPRAPDLVRQLEENSQAAWPLGLVASAAQGLAPALSSRALELALARARLQPALAQEEIAGLALLASRQQLGRGEQLAAQLTDPRSEAWFWRELATSYNSAGQLEPALAAGLRIAEPRERALSLAATARLFMEADAQQGREVFTQALNQADQIESQALRAATQGEVAALAAQSDAALGLALAARVEPGLGARVKLLRAAAAQLRVSDPGRCRSALESAWREAHSLPLLGQRLKAQSLLVQDMAPLDPRRAREMLSAMPAGDYPQRAEAQTALVLNLAASDLEQALTLARSSLRGESRGLALCRLAGMAQKKDQALAKSLYQEAWLWPQAGPADQLAQNLAPALAALDARKGIDIALGIGDKVARAATLLAVARSLFQAGEDEAGLFCLRQAEMALSSLGPKEAIDKVRLLGDMGRQWASREAEKSRRYLRQAAEAAAGLE